MTPKHKSWSQYSDWLYNKHPDLWGDPPTSMRITIQYKDSTTGTAMVPYEFQVWDRGRKERFMDERFPGWIGFSEF